MNSTAAAELMANHIAEILVHANQSGVWPRKAGFLRTDDFGYPVLMEVYYSFSDSAIKFTRPQKRRKIERGAGMMLRMAVEWVLSENPRMQGAYPATLLQSEILYLMDKLPTLNPDGGTSTPKGRSRPHFLKFEEDLGLILYSVDNTSGLDSYLSRNLYQQISERRLDLGLEADDLERRLVIVSPGLKPDEHSPIGASICLIEGRTEVFAHEILEEPLGYQDTDVIPANFSYALRGGLPAMHELGTGSRTLWAPNHQRRYSGIRVISRDQDLNLTLTDQLYYPKKAEPNVQDNNRIVLAYS